MKFCATTFSSATLTVLLAGCAVQPTRLPPPLPMTNLPPAEQPQPLVESRGRTELREHATPVMPGQDQPTSAGLAIRDNVPTGLGTEPVSVNLVDLPVPTFINDVLGNSLGLTFQLDPAVQSVDALITLRTSRPQTPVEFYRIARQVLANYGVELIAEGNLVRVQVAPTGSTIEPPIIFSGRALPDVPLTHRPVFYLMQLNAIRANEANRWLRAIYGEDVSAQESEAHNALLLSGRPDKVRQAVEAIRVFDRPSMRGRASTRLEPAFMSAEQLAQKLTEVLVAEGYGASNALNVPASILILPVQAVNSVVIFTGDVALLRHATAWARELDRPNPAAGNRSVFYYQVQNTKASDIASVLSGAGTASRPDASNVVDPAAPQGQPPAPTGGSTGAPLLVDEPRNALIFQGDPAEWERLLPLVRQMDREARQVMIELTIAEVTLDEGQEFGVSWLAKTGHGRFNGAAGFGSLPGAGAVAGSGLTYLLDVAGQSRAVLRAFAEDNRVSILSTPRLLVKSGEEARIDVGTEVPIITSRNTSPQQTEGTTGLLQSIQYRKTGIILSIQPTVYSDDRVDLTLSQEVSEALPLADGDSIGSPSIFNRSVETSLTLRDGGSVVIGGLMSSRETNADSGVPFIKNVPVLGNLFKSQTRRRNKTELVLLIVPYIVGSDERANELTRSIGDSLELLELPSSGSLAIPPAGPASMPSLPSPPATFRPVPPAPVQPPGPAYLRANPEVEVTPTAD